MERVRILYLLSEFMYGSKVRQVCDLINGLDRSVFDVEIGALEVKNEARPEIDKLGVPCHEIRVYPPRYPDPRRILGFMRSPLQLREGHYDIVHSLLYQSICIEPLLVKGLTNAKYVYTKTNLQWENHRLNWRLKSQLADVIITISSATKALLENEGFSRKTTNIYLGIDTDVYSDRGISTLKMRCNIPSNGFVFGCAAQFVEWKQHLLLIRAFEDVYRQNEKVFLILAGPNHADGYYESVRRSVGASNARKHIFLVGTVTDMPDFYAGIDVFVLPSRNEPFGYVYIEAMSCGRPVIACAAGGPLDIIENGTSGFVVPAEGIGELGRHMSQYAANPDLANEHGRNGRRIVEERFSNTVMVREHERLYNELLGRALPA